MHISIFRIRPLLFGAAILFMSMPGVSQTIGLIYSDPVQVAEGYTLFMPTSWTEAYLLNTDGLIVNSWPGLLQPGQAVYLTESGNLLKTCQYPGPPMYFEAGGRGGLLRLYSWDNELLWTLPWWGEDSCQLHDCEYIEETGTVLFISWYRVSSVTAIACGRDLAALPDGELWSDRIIEVRPVGSDGYEIVWQWDAWDHLIQNTGPARPNFGNPSEHPGRININFFNGGGAADWLHCNGVDYNPELDQVLISCHNFNEIWIVDHSTCDYDDPESGIAAAAGEAGDLIYRWGNPAAWDMGTPIDQQLFGQHDAQWVLDERPGAGNITIYNNGTSGPRRPYSTVDEIEPPLLPDGRYELSSGEVFGPEAPVGSYSAEIPVEFFSAAISGATRLWNGNTIVCEGNSGRIFEVTDDGETVWEYINPVTIIGPRVQGTVITEGNQVFKVQKYAPDYPGFSGRDLTPGSTVEIPEDKVVENIIPRKTGLAAYPNPFNSALYLGNAALPVTVYDIKGNQISMINSNTWKPAQEVVGGLYILEDNQGHRQRVSFVK